MGNVFAVTSGVLSAVLIITNVIFDWMQYTGMDIAYLDSPSNTTNALKSNVSSKPNPTKECVDGSEKDELTKKFMYFNIAGTLLAILQLINIIVQTKSKLSADEEDSKKKYGLDGKIEVFLVTVLIEIPQNYMLLRYEDICINNCDIEWDMKKVKRFSSGLFSVLSALWRYITSISLPERKEDEPNCDPCGCCDCFALQCQHCIEKCFFCIFPCCKCLSEEGCLITVPCCFTVVWKCRNMNETSGCITVEPECCCKCCCDEKEEDLTWKGDGLIVILVSVAPTVIHVIMYTMRIVKYFCGATHLELFEFLHTYIESNVNNVIKWVISKVPIF